MFLKEKQTKHLHPVKVPIKSKGKIKPPSGHSLLLHLSCKKVMLKQVLRTERNWYVLNTESAVKVAQLCLTLWDLMDGIVHGILQARILKWVTFPFSRGSSQPRDQTQVSPIAGGFFTNWAMRVHIIKGKALEKEWGEKTFIFFLLLDDLKNMCLN